MLDEDEDQERKEFVTQGTMDDDEDEDDDGEVYEEWNGIVEDKEEQVEEMEAEEEQEQVVVVPEKKVKAKKEKVPVVEEEVVVPAAEPVDESFDGESTFLLLYSELRGNRSEADLELRLRVPTHTRRPPPSLVLPPCPLPPQTIHLQPRILQTLSYPGYHPSFRSRRSRYRRSR